jgi:hypothetical protein
VSVLRADVEPPEGRPLVLDGQRSDTRLRGWCERGPENLRLLIDGTYVRPRCKRRDCARCWALRSRELARCLVLDARQSAPGYCVTLTTHDPATTAATYRKGSEALFKRLRRRFGPVEFFGAIEFTTGRGALSGGHRRLHGHYLLKSEPLDVIDVERIVRDSWKRSTGAYVVEVAELVSPGAALGYLGLHHRKPSQAPPREWRGMTERASRRYWSTPIAELRSQARQELAAEAHAWRTGMPLELAALEVAARGEGRLMQVRTLADATVLEPMGELLR